MSQQFLTPIDLNKNELRQAVIHLLGTDVVSPVEGQLWWNTTDHAPKVYDGTTVHNLFNPLLLNGQNSAYYLARANHTGTQLAATISDFDTQVRTNRLDQMAAPTGPVSMNNQKITSLANGTATSDAINLGQLQAAVQGFSWKTSVRAASTANGTLASAFENGDTLDGVTLVTGDRILLKNQTTASEDGIYTVNASGAPTRAVDADTFGELENATVMVNEGTANAGTAWNQTVELTSLSDNQNWIQFFAGATLTFSAPLLLTANNVTLELQARLTVVSSKLDLASGIVTPGTYTKVTVDTYGRTTGGAEIVSGTGILVNTAAATYTTRTITGTSNRITVTNGDGVSGNPTLDISSSYVGQASITTLGTITTGVWTGTTIAVANGGTGATTAAGARANLGATGKYSALIGDGSSTSISITQGTHGLATNGQMIAALYDASSGALVYPDISINNSNGTVTFGFSVAPTSNQYRAVIVG